MCMCVGLCQALCVSVCQPVYLMAAKSSFASNDSIFQAPSKSGLLTNLPLTLYCYITESGAEGPFGTARTQVIPSSSSSLCWPSQVTRHEQDPPIPPSFKACPSAQSWTQAALFLVTLFCIPISTLDPPLLHCLQTSELDQQGLGSASASPCACDLR